MSQGVIVAVEHYLEAEIVTTIEASRDLEVVRRCADTAELLSSAAAGIADLAVVSPGFRGVDREALRALAGFGVVVAGVVSPGDNAGEARLRQLGIMTILVGGSGIEALEGLRDPHGRVGGVSAQLDLAGLGRDGSPSFGSVMGELDGREDAAHKLEDVRGRIVAVWGPTGAPGRTTIATSLAFVLAERGLPTLVVDLDTWGASVAQTLGLVDEAPGLAAAARASEQGTLDLAALSRLSPQASPGLRVLTGLPAAHRWPEARAGAVENILRLARNLVEVVVLDCGFAIEDDEELSYDTAAPRRNATTLTALAEADSLVMVGSADPIGLQRLVRASVSIGTVPSPTPVVVVNKVRASVAGAHPDRAIREVLGRFAGLDDILVIPWAGQECDSALLAGRAVPEVARHGILAQAVETLADRLVPQSSGAATRRADRRVLRRRRR